MPRPQRTRHWKNHKRGGGSGKRTAAAYSVIHLFHVKHQRKPLPVLHPSPALCVSRNVDFIKIVTPSEYVAWCVRAFTAHRHRLKPAATRERAPIDVRHARRDRHASKPAGILKCSTTDARHLDAPQCRGNLDIPCRHGRNGAVIIAGVLRHDRGFTIVNTFKYIFDRIDSELGQVESELG